MLSFGNRTPDKKSFVEHNLELKPPLVRLKVAETGGTRREIDALRRLPLCGLRFSTGTAAQSFSGNIEAAAPSARLLYIDSSSRSGFLLVLDLGSKLRGTPFRKTGTRLRIESEGRLFPAGALFAHADHPQDRLIDRAVSGVRWRDVMRLQEGADGPYRHHGHRLPGAGAIAGDDS
jgi:hypothetical protein